MQIPFWWKRGYKREGGSMKRVIYSKYSDARSRQFALMTNIFLDQGKMSVEKKAIYPEGIPHIQVLPRYCRQLTEQFAGSPISVQTAELSKDGDSCVFPYISGQTFEDELKSLCEHGLYEQAISRIDKFMNVIRENCSDKPFEMTDAFKSIFGEEEFPANMRCAELNNIDYAFGNIILAENGMNLIDYEWCFDFPVPTDFILFRSLLYFVYSLHDKNELIKRGIFARSEYSDGRFEQFRRMEDRFQAYIKGDTVSISSMKENLLQRTLHIHELYTGRDREILKLNGIIEQKENYINEQRDMLNERDQKIHKLNDYLDRISSELCAASKKSGISQQTMLGYLSDFLNKGIVRRLFHFYSGKRGKNEDQ